MKIIEDKNGRIEACKYMEADLLFFLQAPEPESFILK
ncbi:hypothetical protein BATR1942_01715 [Bacillus atrophaeus 1942]|uniref:Uncharacterized protein n=1 Tax=Bacillus atrophaeus (strain 1942) TaxID=720555 RepID=A0ABN3Z5W9_BACA1|nr:hypothetical protein BATR1942_01715 [Bacillus atrophaeus 1942]